MRTDQKIGPGRSSFQKREWWTCLNCGVESFSPKFRQCQNGININASLKRVLAEICCSEQIIKLFAEKTTQLSNQKPPFEMPSCDNSFKITLPEDMFGIANKRFAEEFLPEREFNAANNLRRITGKIKTPQNELSNDDIVTLLNIFKPLLTDSKVTLYHKSTRMCLACERKNRKERYDGSINIPEIICPVCESVMG